jgi:tripartite-type tricarboxylate transporter receptor subunit TctC
MWKSAKKIGIALAIVGAPSLSAAAEWPERNITFIIPYAPGGVTDSVGRVTAQYVSEALGTTVVVENRPGAGGIVGTEMLSEAKPDGYTFCVCGSGAVSIAPVAQKISYNPLEDFEFVSTVNTNPQIVLVNSKLPIDSIDSLISYAQANPSKLNYASSGVGGLMHFSVALFQSKTNTKMTHVPYAGGAPATAAVLAGEADLTFTNSTDAMPHLEGEFANRGGDGSKLQRDCLEWRHGSERNSQGDRRQAVGGSRGYGQGSEGQSRDGEVRRRDRFEDS